MYHFFDGPHIAREIGYTNGDGGFQTEVGFADLAIGVLGILCAWFRDKFMLAAVVTVSICCLGDAYGHLSPDRDPRQPRARQRRPGAAVGHHRPARRDRPLRAARALAGRRAHERCEHCRSATRLRPGCGGIPTSPEWGLLDGIRTTESQLRSEIYTPAQGWPS
jgi:hypothetical protein